ncbi:MAG TPA: ABC transporter permease [Bryobacteraceae bacterium]|nr:ABC transporter permease [Bryobacteraceae bacterium]
MFPRGVESVPRWIWLEQLRQDIRYAFRQFRRAPAFALTATLTLALGIGATTAIFTLIHALLLKSLPVSRPEQLYTVGDAKHVGVYSGMAVDWDIFSYELYKHLRDHTTGFEELAAFQGDPRRVGVRRVGSPNAAESYQAQYISGNYFSTFGVPAFAGRTINAEDDRPGAPPVAVLSYRVWQEKFALEPSVLGSTFSINGTPVMVVGAAPPGFFGDSLRANSPDVWLPLASEPAVNHAAWVNNADLHWLYLMGRVKPGTDVRTIEARMQVTLRQWLQDRSNILGKAAAAQIPRQTLHIRHGGSGIGLLRATYSAGLELLMAVSGFVLLIVCANLANLMLARGLARRRQTSISLALGAARSRLVRQALTECVLLALIGGAGGVAIAFAGTQTLLSAVFTGSSYVPINPAPDLAVLGFAFAASLLTGLVFGVAPAWSANCTDPVDALQGAGRSTEQAGAFPQRTLVVLQAALSLVLLSVAGLLTESLRNLEHQKFGFATEGRVAVRIDPNLAGYKPDELEPLYQRIRERLRQLPGIISVSYALFSPMSGSSWTTDVSIEGQPPPAMDGRNLSAWARVGPNYFDTVGTHILRGRPIEESDTASSRHVAVINETFARRYFPNENPLGQHFGANEAKYSRSFEIVGIAEDAKYNQPGRPNDPMYFIPRPQVTQYEDAGTTAFERRSLYVNDVVLHFAAGLGSMEPEIRRAFAEVDPNLTVISVRTLETQVKRQVSQDVLVARLTSLFGLTALLLASIGLYGVASYSVARRSREIGIRMALGANRQSVLTMVLRNAYTLVGVGLVAGSPCAVAMGRLMASRLFGISWYNPVILAGAAIVLAVFALAATILPARRAAALDPMQTLRGDS